MPATASLSVPDHPAALAPPVVLPPPGDGAPRLGIVLLPVEPGDSQVWGDPAQAWLDVPARYRRGIVAVVPSFKHMPWYGNHPTDAERQQAHYLIDALVPAANQRWPALRRRWVTCGFSKGGWGAVHLLLCHPEVFFAAAAWDAPLAVTRPRYGADAVYPHAIEWRRASPIGWLPWRAAWLRRVRAPRVFASGWDRFGGDLARWRAACARWGIPVDDPTDRAEPHRWSSTWLAGLLGKLKRHHA